MTRCIFLASFFLCSSLSIWEKLHKREKSLFPMICVMCWNLYSVYWDCLHAELNPILGNSHKFLDLLSSGQRRLWGSWRAELCSDPWLLSFVFWCTRLYLSICLTWIPGLDSAKLFRASPCDLWVAVEFLKISKEMALWAVISISSKREYTVDNPQI